MSCSAPLSMLLEVLARSRRELETLESEREAANALKERARALIDRAHGVPSENRAPADSER